MKATQTLTKPTDDAAVAALLGDETSLKSTQITELKRLLDSRSRHLREMDKAVAALVEHARAEADDRTVISTLLISGGKAMRDIRRDFMDGSDVQSRIYKLLGGRVIGADAREDKSKPLLTLTQLADAHDYIIKQFEKGE